jgi:hypothetical protein
MRFPSLLALSTTLLAAACTTPSPGGRMGSEHGHMDMAQMCAMHRQSMEGKSPAEQQAAIEAHVRKMHGTASPEMVAMHRNMMDSRCGGSAGTTK